MASAESFFVQKQRVEIKGNEGSSSSGFRLDFRIQSSPERQQQQQKKMKMK